MASNSCTPAAAAAAAASSSSCAAGGVNVLVTGTPGTGKSSLCASIVDAMDGYKHVEVGRVVKEHGLHEGRDEELDTLIVDEDACLDHLDPIVSAGGCVVDYHSCDLFPERWFQLIVVLRTSTEALHDRLTKRGYSERKLRENIECEIFGVVEEEARESYAADIVWVRQSNTVDDMERNSKDVLDFVLRHRQRPLS